MDFDQLLRRARLFQGVDDQALAGLVNIAQLRSFDRGERICRQDELKPGIFVVARGSARALVGSEDGREHVTRLLASGDAFADMATLGNFPCPASVEATEVMKALFLSSPQIDQWLCDHPSACRQVLTNTATEAGRLIRQITRLTLLNAHSRVAQFLLERDGSVRWGKRHVASYLGLTSETFSRVLRRLIEARLIEAPPDEDVRILDPEGLRAVSMGHEVPERAVA